MKLGSVVAVAVVCASLSGCGVARQMETTDARHQMQKSLADYKACLTANLTNTAACNGAKTIYEADLSAYEAQTGRTSSVSVRQ